MRKSTFAVTVGAAALIAPLTTVTAQAVPTGLPVEIVAHTSMETEVSDFDASLEGCEKGTVVNGANAAAHFTPWGGSFIGDKEFTCAGGESGFTLRLRARFGGGGSTGSWTVVDGWGDFAGLKGSGSLVGIPRTAVLDDIYTGSFR